MKKDNTPHKSKIGGQALFEGIMMRGVTSETMAVRKRDGTIHTETIRLPERKWYQKTPFVRGVFNFILQMKNGYSYMTKSMEISGFMEEIEEEEKAEAAKKAAKKAEKEAAKRAKAGLPEPESPPQSPEESGESRESGETPEKSEADKKKENAIISVIGMIGGIVIAVGLFMFLPNWVATAVNSAFARDLESLHSLIAGIIRIILFVVYMWAISLMKEIRVTYEYHGAEHKTIAAFEAGEEISPDNVAAIRKYTRFHPRCGTSFIFLVLAVSILVYSVLPIRPTHIIGYMQDWFNVEVSVGPANVIRTVVQLLFMPVLVGITYEIIKVAGKHDRNIIMRVISAPGLLLQRLTTLEPTDKQLEVAVAAILPVLPANDEEKENDKW